MNSGALHATLANSSANHLRLPLLSAGRSANDPVALRSMGKIGICKACSDAWHRSTFGAFISGPLMLCLICAAPRRSLTDWSVSSSRDRSAVHLTGNRKKIPNEVALPPRWRIGVAGNISKYLLTLLIKESRRSCRWNGAFPPPLTFHERLLHLSRHRAAAASGTNRTPGGFWYSVIWLLLFEQGHFPEKLQIKNSIILLQRHFRKDSSVIISYIVFNSPSSFFSLKKETKMKKVEFFFFSFFQSKIQCFHNCIKVPKFGIFQSLEN